MKNLIILPIVLSMLMLMPTAVKAGEDAHKYECGSSYFYTDCIVTDSMTGANGYGIIYYCGECRKVIGVDSEPMTAEQVYVEDYSPITGHYCHDHHGYIITSKLLLNQFGEVIYHTEAKCLYCYKPLFFTDRVIIKGVQ